MPRILLEGDTFEFQPANRNALSEALTSGTFPTKLTIPGKFSECNKENGNRRIYPRQVWEKNLKEGSLLQEGITKCRSVGLLEHPKDGNISLLSPISHLVTKAFLEGNDVNGEITLLTGLAEGRKMAVLIEAGYTPLVSSRGYGSVVKRADGLDEVQDDFVCESWDLVYNPSFKSAELAPKRESVTAPAAAPAPVGALTEQLAPSLPATPVQPVTKTPDHMDLKAINESVNALRNVDVSKLDPRRLAEGLNQMQSLHREAATLGASDNKMSWDVGQVHESLKALEVAWTESVKAPAATVLKLQEQQGRTLNVLKEVGKLGIKYRDKLIETTKSLGKKETTLTEVVRRGNEWRKRSLKNEAALALATRRLNLAYESLDVFTKRYHEDTTALARHALMVEHKVTDEALLKRINEATRVDALIAIKEELKKPAAAPAPVVESVTPPKAPVAAVPGAAPAAAPVPPKAPQRVESMTRAFSVSESVGMTRRLAGVVNG